MAGEGGVKKPETDNPTGDSSQEADRQNKTTLERVEKQDTSNESNEKISGTDKE
jgi:hypothetical protein